MKYLKTLNELRKMRPNNRILDIENLERELRNITTYRDLVDIKVDIDGDIVSYFEIKVNFDPNKPEYKLSLEEEKVFESLKWFNKNGLFDVTDNKIIFRIGKDEDFISTYYKPEDKIFYTSVINGSYFPNYKEINNVLKEYENK